jgi:hypothetical protein
MNYADDDPTWDDDDPPDDAELTESAMAYCPYCGEEVEILVDPAGGGTQSYVEDCEVCCQPWQVTVFLDHQGGVSVTLGTLDDG